VNTGSANKHVIATHHIFQKTYNAQFDMRIYHPLMVNILGQDKVHAWIESSFNKFHLPTDPQLALQAGTPLHLGNHHWVQQMQWQIIADFQNWEFGEYTAYELVQIGDVNKPEYIAMKAAFEKYIDRVRDLTAWGIKSGQMPLTAADLRFGNLTPAQAETLIGDFLDPRKFRQGAQFDALGQTLKPFTDRRDAMAALGLPIEWMNFESAQQFLQAAEAAERTGKLPFSAELAAADPRSLAIWLNSLPDGELARDWVVNKAKAMGLAHRLKGLPFAAWIGAVFTVLAISFDAKAALNAETVEERNLLLTQSAGFLALEAHAALKGWGMIKGGIVPLILMGVSEYLTNQGFRMSVNQFGQFVMEATPQIVHRAFDGDTILPAGSYLELRPRPGAYQVPYFAGLNSLIPDGGGTGSAAFQNWVSGLQKEWWNEFSMIETWAKTHRDNIEFKVKLIYFGGTPIGFVVDEEGVPDYVSASGKRTAMPKGTMVMIWSQPNPADGTFNWVPVGAGSGVEVTDANLKTVGAGLLNSMKLTAVLQGKEYREALTRTTTTGDTSVTSTRIVQGPAVFWVVIVSKDGVKTSSGNGKIDDIYIFDDDPVTGGRRSVKVARSVTFPWGPATLFLEIDVDGNVTRKMEVNGQTHVIDNADSELDPHFKGMEDGLAPATETKEARQRESLVNVVESTPRDLLTALFQTDSPAIVAVHRYINDLFPENDHRVTAVSARLARDRLLDKYRILGLKPNEGTIEQIFEDARMLEEQINLVGSIAGVFGSTLGRVLAGDNKTTAVVLSGVLGALATSAGQGIATGLTYNSLHQGFQTGRAMLPSNIKGAATGAVSSYITAELIKAVGLTGTAGELVGAAAGSVIGQIVSGLAAGQGAEAVTNAFKGAGAIAIWTAVGSYVGTELASRIIQFDTTGGQLGAQLGSAVGGITGAYLAVQWAGPGFAAAGPIGALVGAFLGYIVGGLIGSVFSGSPRSGAGTEWDEAQGRFVAGDSWAYGGATPEAGKSLATSAAESFNGLLAMTGGTLLNPGAVDTGHYGTRKGNFVYRSSSAPQTDAIEFKGDNGAEKLISHGVGIGLADPDFQLAGGDVYLKRALYNSSAKMLAGGAFDLTTLIGDIAIARDWAFYRNNPGAVEAVAESLEGGEKETYIAGWVITTARAEELGLDRRHAADWYGGFGFLLDQARATPATVEFLLNYDISIGKYVRSMKVGNFTINDATDVANQTFIELGSGNDVFDLTAGFLADQRGLMVNEHDNIDIAVAGEDYAAVTDAEVAIPWSRRGEIALAIAANASGEPEESFRLGFTGAQRFALHGPDATITIVDAGALPYLQVGRSFAAEGDGHAIFRLTLSRAASTAISLNLSLAEDGATKEEDWLSAIEVSASPDGGWVRSDSLTIAAGETEYFVRVPIVRDNGLDAQNKVTGKEANEAFTLGARVTAGAAALSNGDRLAVGTGTIVDGDSGHPLVWMDDATVHSGMPAAVGFGLSKLPLPDIGPPDPEEGPAEPPASLTVSTSDRRALHVGIAATVDLGEGDDTYYASNLGDTALGGAGNDTIYGGRLDDWIYGGEGNDSLNAGSKDPGTLGGDGNYLHGGAGDDVIIGREGSDWLEGGDGVDTLEGGDGGDVLTGGAGRGDVLRGGRGDDQYLFRRGDVGSSNLADADIIRDESGLSMETVVGQAYNDLSAAEIALLQQDALSGALWLEGRGLDNWEGGGVQVTPAGAAAGGEDVLVLGKGITIEDIKILKSADGLDFIIELWPEGVFEGDRVILKDWFSSFNKIETLRFDDGNEIRLSDFDTIILGSDGSETIIGTEGTDFVHAGSGDDIVFLMAGNDFGNGGLGNDTVSGDSGDDVVVGAHGDDTLFGGGGRDFVSGGRGSDTLYGGEGHDVLTGGAGADELIGGFNDDIFKFARGDGHDTIIDSLSEEWEIVWVAGQGFRSGYQLNGDGTIGHTDGSVIHDGEHWLTRTRYEAESGTLWRHMPASADAIVADNGRDAIEFGLGIDINDLHFTRSNGNRDLLIGVEQWGSQAKTFAAMVDQIRLKEWGPAGTAAAHGSIEVFSFVNVGAIDVSDIRLDGGSDGNDSVTGTAGVKNWITGNAGDDQLTGDSKDDILNGNSGRDILIGLGGRDTLLGGGGDDVLIGGAGNSTVSGDLLVGGEGMDVASYETAATGVKASLEAPRPATDTTAGEAAGDTYVGIEGLRGSDSADVLSGNVMDNELRGGKGDDSVRGALGDDTYIFGRGDGKDTIDDRYSPSKRVLVDREGRLERPFVAQMNLVSQSDGQYQFEHVVANAESGEILYRKRLAPTSNRELPMPGTFEQAGWLPDDEGRPIYQFDGNEVAAVEPEGPAGNDVLLFADHTGLAGYSGEQSIGLSDLIFAFDTGDNANDLLISLVGSSTDQIRIVSFRNGAAAHVDRAIETIEFADGSSVRLAGLLYNESGTFLTASSDTQAAPVDELIVGTSGADTLAGGFGDDSLSGLDGNDILQGGDGDDQLSGGLGADKLEGGAGVDTATYVGSDGGTGVTINLASTTGAVGGEAAGDTFFSVENVIGTHFNDNITGNSGDNIIKGNRGNDNLTGGLGADVLVGDDGNDTLTGNVHDDNLAGGAGSDVLSGGGDRDVLAGGDGNDILRGDGTSGNESGGNILVNFSFENTGDAANDVAQPWGLTTTDLPGWKSNSDRPVQLTTSSAGVTPTEGSKALHLDDGTGNVEISQEVKDLAAGETLSLLLSSAARTATASGGFEVLWNGQVVLSFASGTATMTTRSKSLVAVEGTNILTLRGTGAVDGLGAIIDNVRLSRTQGAADTLSGGAGVDRLEGGGGRDTLVGGDGNDNSLEVVAGSTYGGLFGGVGDDVLDGGAGDDSLDGGAGADKFIFRAGSGNDSVVTGTGGDELVFEELPWNRLWFSRPTSSTDLVITAIGGGASVRVVNWFGSGASQARRIVAGDKMLSRFDVQALVAAMAVESGQVPAAWPQSPQQPFIDALTAAWQSSADYVDRAVLTGTASADTLVPESYWVGPVRYEGLAGDDTVNAGAADDVIVGGAGNDTLNGGLGNDEFRFGTESGFDMVDGGAGADRLAATVTSARINLQSLANVEQISGANFADVQIVAASGARLDLSAVSVEGIAQINGSAGAETLTGSAGADRLFGAGGNDILSGGLGNDWIQGGEGVDSHSGGEGVDTLDQSFTGSAQRIDLAAGRVTIAGVDESATGFENAIGGSGDDEMIGGSGSNRLDGSWGSDRIDGGDGTDILTGGDGGDLLIGGLGSDTASYSSQASQSGSTTVIDGMWINGVVVDLAAGTSVDGITPPAPENLGRQGDAEGDWFYQIENLEGTRFNDSLKGDDGVNRLTGGGGDDLLDGGQGDDIVVYSGNRADYLISTVDQVSVTDLKNEDGDDGFDRLVEIQGIQFADVFVSLGVNPNNPPQIGDPPLADQVWYDGEEALYQIPSTAFFDPDQDALFFHASLADGSALPLWLAFEGVSGTFSGTPDFESIGDVYSVKVTASDGEFSVADIFLLTVAEAVGPDIVGTPGNDTLFGTFRRETMIGLAGHDLFFGSAGADRIDGGAGFDTVTYSNSASAVFVDLAIGLASGGDAAGDQYIAVEGVTGSDFNDELTGSDDANELVGGFGNDTIAGGEGDDLLDGESGLDVLRGGEGNDSLFARALAGGALDDVVDGGGGSDTLYLNRSSNGATLNLGSGSGNPTSIEHVVGSSSADTVIGNEQVNNLSGGLGNDTLSGVGGNDTLTGGSGHDGLYGGTGNDLLYGDSGDDRLQGGTGTNTLYGGTGIDTADYRGSASGLSIVLDTGAASGDGMTNDNYAGGQIENADGSDFADSILGSAGSNVLKGFAGNDSISGGDGDDQLDGGDDSDTISGGLGADTLTGGTGNDVLSGEAGIDVIDAGAGNDTIHLAADAEDWVDGGAGIDTATFAAVSEALTIDLAVSAADKLTNVENLISGLNNDQLFGSALANEIDAGGGHDNVKGREGDDILRGGSGDDILEGGAGSDELAGGEGVDAVAYASSAAGAGFTSGPIGGAAGVEAVTRTLNGVDVDLAAGTGANGDAAGDRYSSIEWAGGSAAADRLRGTDGNNLLAGGAGDDLLIGGGGDDTLWGEGESDILYGEDGADALHGLQGDDRLFGGGGNDLLNGAEGNDVLGDDGGTGDDILNGGAGDDILLGSTGADTYDGGIGVDSLDFRASAAGVRVNLSSALVSGVSANRGSGGDAEGDLYVDRSIENLTGSELDDELSGTDLANRLSGRGGADRLNAGAGSDFAEGNSGADIIRGEAGDDTLSGGSENDDLDGGTENDTLYGETGNDTLAGGAGVDSLWGGDGDDIIHLTAAGEDLVDGGAGIDQVVYTTNVALAIDLTDPAQKLTDIEQVTTGGGHDQLKGSAGANLLDGGIGNDVLDGRGGADQLTGGDGDDTVTYAGSGAGSDINVGAVGASSSAGVAAVTRIVNGVDVSIATGTGANADAAGDTLTSVENLTGSAHSDRLTGGGGANVLTGGLGDDLIYARGGNDTVAGDDGHDILFGDSGADTLRGGAGDDRLFGGLDSDLLLGGDGNDILSEEGGGGDDVFHGEAGDDLLVGSAGADTYDGGAGTDTLNHGGSTAGVQVNLSAATVNLVLANRGAGGDAEGDTYAAGTIENVTGSAFADILTGSSAANVLRGGAGADQAAGGAGADTLHGDGGADTLRGEAGADILHGGTENDSLFGGTENDVLNGDDGDDVLAGEDGIDTLNGGAGNDVVTGGAGADVIDGGIGDDLVHLSADGEDMVDGGAGIDTASFATLSAALTVDLANSAADKLTNVENLVTGSGNDILSGSALANRLEGGSGNDILEGRGGSDALIGGDGIDKVSYASSVAGAGFTSGAVGAAVVNSTTIAAAVTRTLTGVDVDLAAGTAAQADAAGDTFSGIENLEGSAHSDRLRGTSSSSEVSGLAGDDLIYGGAGNDTLKGDAGNDIIYGEAGVDDLFGGDGDDRLFGGGETDHLYGGAGNDLLDAGDAGDHLEGGEGNDILIGGLGDDGYLFGKTSGADTIYNYDTEDSTDSVVFDNNSNVKNTDLWFSKVAGTRDLIVKVLGTTSSVTIKDWFANSTAGNYTPGSDAFAVDMFVADAFYVDRQVNVPQLISIMAAQAQPASFEALSTTVQDQIKQTWANNTPPTITADPANPTSVNEDGSVNLHFKVADGQTAPASITITAVSGGVLQTIQASDITVIDASTRRVTVRALPNASGAGSVTLTAFDGFWSSAPLVVSLPVTAMADMPLLGLKALSGNAGTTVEVDGTLAGAVIALLADSDEVFNSITIENIPVGAVLRSGSNSFTAAAGSTTATITGWALSTLQLVLPASSTDFVLTVRATSREPSNGAISAQATGTIDVTVNGTPTGVTFEGSSAFKENVSHPSGMAIGTLAPVDPGDSTGTYAYAVTGVETARFMTVGNQLWLKPGVALDFEAGDITVGIRITDNSTGAPVTMDSSVVIRPANVNEAPTNLIDVNPALNQVNDTATAGATVGITMQATDPEGSLRYSITSDLMNWFAINQTTGVITVRTGAVIDYELTTNGTASINVQVTDGEFTISAPNVTITINDVNEAPLITSPNSASINENSAAGTYVSTITSSDPDKDNLSSGEFGHVYSIVGGTGASLFEIVQGNKIHSKVGAAFNYEGTKSYTLNLQVRDNHNAGLVHEQLFTVHVLDVNEAPTGLADVDPAPNQVAEGAAPGTVVGLTFQASDPEGSLSYSLAEDPLGWFAINSATGVVTVRAGAVINYEQAPNGIASINVKATDNANQSISLISVPIAIIDSNEEPYFLSASSANLSETARGGVFVIALASGDPDLDSSPFGEAGHVYSIAGGTGQALFEIVNGNQLRTRAGASFDYDNGQTSYSLNLQVRDNYNNGLIKEQPFTVYLTPVNEALTGFHDSDWSSNWVTEGATGGTYTGISLFANDPENSVVYSITNDPFNWFTVNPYTGVVTVRYGAIIDSELTTNGTVSINVQATDNFNSALTMTNLVINVADVNEAPSFSSGSSASLMETAAGGSIVAHLSAYDPDRDNTAFGELGHIYSITGGTGAGLFEIVGSQIRTKAGSTFDYDAGTRSYSLALQVRDNYGNGLSATQNFFVNISNVDEAPTIPGAMPELHVNENSEYLVSLWGSTDPEGGAVRYEFSQAGGSGNPGGMFAIDQYDSNNGLIRLITPVDYETLKDKPYFTAAGSNRGYVDVRIVAADSANLKSPERTFRYYFYNLNDNAPYPPATGWLSPDTYKENGNLYGAVPAFVNGPWDPDGNLNPLTMQMVTNPGGMFAYNPSNGALSWNVNSFDFENPALGIVRPYNDTLGYIKVTFRASDGTHSSTSDVWVYVRDVNEAATFASGLAATSKENQVVSSLVTTVQAVDPDIGTFGAIAGYRIVGGNSNGTNYDSFAINSAGQITIANGVDFERLASAYYDLQIVATDQGGLDSAVGTVRITIENVSERVTIFDGSVTLPMRGQSSAGFAPGYGYSASVSGVKTEEIVREKYIWRDSNNNGIFGDFANGVGDQALAEYYQDNWSGYDEVAQGYMWSGTRWSSAFLQQLPPIVLDLSGSGQFLSSISVRFDVDGDGDRDQAGWIAGDQGFLVLDRNGNGLIDSGSELSFAQDLPGAASDLEGLRAYDSNGDGSFDALDSRFGEFRVWQDADEDGETDSGELRSLADVGVAGIDLAIAKPATPSADSASQALLGTSTFRWAGGGTGLVGDVALRWDHVADPAGGGAKAGEAMPLPAGARVAIDRDGDGIIDPATEVAGTAFALADFDSNGDKLISALDADYFDLRLWRDSNSNGRAEPDEILGLDRAGLTAISATAASAPAPAPAPAPAAPPPAPDAPAASPPAAPPAPPAAAPAPVAPAAPAAPAAAAPAAAEPAPAAPSPVEAEDSADDAQPAATSESGPAPATIEPVHTSFAKKDEKYRITAEGGELFVTLRKAKGSLDPNSGRIAPASLLTFKDRTIGMLAPVILDLDGDGVELIGRTKSKALFDMDGDGVRDDTGWIGKGDGFLVIDRDQDGLISSASELSFLAEKPGARSDLEALGALDSNRDRRIDSSDIRFGELKLWVDSNRNGMTDGGELRSLAEMNVASIDLASAPTQQSVKPGENILIATSRFTMTDGTVRTVGDAALAFRPSGRSAATALGATNLAVAPGLLRAGLEDSALARSLGDDWFRNVDPAGGVDPDLAGVQASSGQALPGSAPIAALGDSRVAQMVQNMASFGLRLGETERTDLMRTLDRPIDIFAA
jgi:Ca2+-binding RTX toxin-like protein